MHTCPVVSGLLAIQTWSPTAIQRHGMSSRQELVDFTSCVFSNESGRGVVSFTDKHAIHSLNGLCSNQSCIDSFRLLLSSFVMNLITYHHAIYF